MMDAENNNNNNIPLLDISARGNSNIIVPAPTSASVTPRQGGLELFLQRIRQCPVPENVDIETLDDVDFVFIVSKKPKKKPPTLIVSSNNNTYEYIPDRLQQKRLQYLDTLRDIYRISYRRVVGKTGDFFLIHLTYYHLGLLAEILRYKWMLKTSDPTSKVVYKSFDFFKWAVNGRNTEFYNCENRSHFSQRLRYDLAYQFLIGAVIPLETSLESVESGLCSCHHHQDGDVETGGGVVKDYDLFQVFSDKIFDGWMVPHTPMKINLPNSKLALRMPFLAPFINCCRVTIGDSGGKAAPNEIKQGQDLREFLCRYCTLKNALLKQHYPSAENEKGASADLWHIIPIHQVVEYVGEKIGFYFAWTELLVMTMLIPAVLGAAMFIALAVYYATDLIYWSTKDEIKGMTFGSFIQYLLVKTCDNYATPFFALLMIIWGTCFREMWIRREAWYKYLWHVENLDVAELESGAVVRSAAPDSFDPAPSDRKTKSGRVFIRIISALITLMFILLVFASVYAINVIQVFSYTFCPQKAVTSPPSLKNVNNNVSSTTSTTTTTTTTNEPTMELLTSLLGASKEDLFTVLICNSFTLAQVLANSMSVFILNLIYTSLAYKLTDWEAHSTPGGYTDALVLKLFAFRFFNLYSILFYTAFGSNILSLKFLSQFVPGSPDYEGELGEANTCEGEPCLLVLTRQLLGILVTQPIFQTLRDLTVASLTSLYAIMKAEKYDADKTNNAMEMNRSRVESGSDSNNDTNDEMLAHELEKQKRLPELTELGRQQFTADEYTQRIVTFGALLMFSVALPPAPALTILFMRIDLTLDIRRIVALYRRPIPHRADGIGSWDNVVNLLTYLGLITNPLIVVLTSGWGSQFENWWKFWIFILFEHVTIALRALVAGAIPDIPRELQREKSRRKRVRQELLNEMVLGRSSTFI